MNKIPNKLKVIISRQFWKNIWKIGPVLQVLRNQTEARKKVNIKTELSEHADKEYFSCSSLYSFNFERKNR